MIRFLFITLFLTSLMACATKPDPYVSVQGQQGYIFECSAGIAQCEARADKFCPNGYDVIEHIEQNTTVMPHYGEYPMLIHIEKLAFRCS
jgi:hypothetical protein